VSFGAALASTFWKDITASDFSTLNSPGNILVNQLGGTFTTTSSSIFNAASLQNAPTGGGGSTAFAIWSDLLTNPEFAVPGSVGQQVALSLPRITPGAVVVNSYLGATGTITIYRSSDNFAADGRSLDIPGPSVNYWPSLSGATIALYVDGSQLCVGSVVTPTGNQVIRFEPSALQTGRFAPTVHSYVAWATLTDGHFVPLASGQFVVLNSQGGP
jgi:hypothetical protein